MRQGARLLRYLAQETKLGYRLMVVNNSGNPLYMVDLSGSDLIKEEDESRSKASAGRQPCDE